MNIGPYPTGPNDTPENGIYTGDALALIKDIPDNSVHLVLVDLPWGIDYSYTSGYQDDPKSYIPFLAAIIAQINRVLKPGYFTFAYQAIKRLRDTWRYFPPNSRLFAACKDFVQIKGLPVEFAFDPVVFWQKPGAKFPLRGMVRDWHIAKTHLTHAPDPRRQPNKRNAARPLETVAYIIAEMTAPGDLVLDPSIGTGTTAIAARDTGRQWLGFEIMPETADLARQCVRDYVTPEAKP